MTNSTSFLHSELVCTHLVRDDDVVMLDVGIRVSLIPGPDEKGQA